MLLFKVPMNTGLMMSEWFKLPRDIRKSMWDEYVEKNPNYENVMRGWVIKG